MSTRASVGIERDNFNIEHVYVNAEGFVLNNEGEGLGQVLIVHHNSYEAARELIALGDLSCVRPKRHPEPGTPHGFAYEVRQPCVTVAYGRDRGDTDTQAQLSDDLSDWVCARQNMSCQFFYLWRGSKREKAEWLFWTDKEGYRPLKEVVACEIERREQMDRMWENAVESANALCILEKQAMAARASTLSARWPAKRRRSARV